jgi:plasmid maintenance system killer protein
MRIRSVRHRGLKRLIENDDERAIRRDLARKVRRILTALQSAQDLEGLQGRQAGVFISLLATGPEPGASPYLATGGSPSS